MSAGEAGLRRSNTLLIKELAGWARETWSYGVSRRLAVGAARVAGQGVRFALERGKRDGHLPPFWNCPVGSSHRAIPRHPRPRRQQHSGVRFKLSRRSTFALRCRADRTRMIESHTRSVGMLVRKPEEWERCWRMARRTNHTYGGEWKAT